MAAHRVALKTSNCAALSHKNAHAAQSPGKWETWSTWARVPADDECLSAPWREECREREEGGGGGWRGGGGRGKVEMERGERHEEEGGSSNHVNPPHKGRAFTKVSPEAPSCCGPRRGNWPQTRVADFISSDNELCTSSCSPNGTKLFFFQLIVTRRNEQMSSGGTSINLLIVYFQHERFCHFFCICLARCRAQCPRPPLCVTVLWLWRWLFPPEDLGSVLLYRPHWNLIHPSARCINNLLYTQGFFLINRHAKLIYCLFVQSEKASRLSFLSGEFSARQS